MYSAYIHTVTYIYICNVYNTSMHIQQLSNPISAETVQPDACTNEPLTTRSQRAASFATTDPALIVQAGSRWSKIPGCC